MRRARHHAAKACTCRNAFGLRNVVAPETRRLIRPLRDARNQRPWARKVATNSPALPIEPPHQLDHLALGAARIEAGHEERDGDSRRHAPHGQGNAPS